MRNILKTLIFVLISAFIATACAQRQDINNVAPPTELNAQLSNKEVAGLLHMREEEKMARDVYIYLGKKWGMRIFFNISESEQRHTNAVKTLLARYTIADPVQNNDYGTFTDTSIQDLYNNLTQAGDVSLLDALIIGATVEDLDIYDLNIFMSETNNSDIINTYTNLRRGSENHLRAFVRQIERNGGSYSPKYISQADFEAIIGANK